VEQMKANPSYSISKPHCFHSESLCAIKHLTVNSNCINFVMPTNQRNLKKASFSKIAFMNTYSILISSMFFLSLTCTLLGKGLSSDVPDLSTQALESLVAHYDGKMGVESDGGSVVSWTPVDGYGDSLDEMIVRSTQIGNGAPELIKYGRPGKLIFDDTNVSADGRYMEGTLSNAESKELTVFWLGHYKADALLPRRVHMSIILA